MTASAEAVPVLHINRPASWTRRRILRCPIDGCLTECVVTVYEWYDADVWCTRCGEGWSGGFLFERPFARGWRARQQKAARAKWAVATHGPFPTFAEMRGEPIARSADTIDRSGGDTTG